MSMKNLLQAIAIAPLLATVVSAPAAAQVCGPDPDGRVAAPDYRETAIFWEPVVEYDRIVLTIAGPCEDIVREFDRGEPIVFDLREIERILDGSYTWELRRVATVDPATQRPSPPRAPRTTTRSGGRSSRRAGSRRGRTPSPARSP